VLELHERLAAGATTSQAPAGARRSITDTGPSGLATALAFTCLGGG